jgi:hypothetical protein
LGWGSGGRRGSWAARGQRKAAAHVARPRVARLAPHRPCPPLCPPYSARIVSVTDARKYEEVPGLQDNAEILFRGIAGRGPWLHWALYGDWVHTKEFLAAALSSAFCVAFDQV